MCLFLEMHANRTWSEVASGQRASETHAEASGIAGRVAAAHHAEPFHTEYLAVPEPGAQATSAFFEAVMYAALNGRPFLGSVVSSWTLLAKVVPFHTPAYRRLS